MGVEANVALSILSPTIRWIFWERFSVYCKSCHTWVKSSGSQGYHKYHHILHINTTNTCKYHQNQWYTIWSPQQEHTLFPPASCKIDPIPMGIHLKIRHSPHNFGLELLHFSARSHSIFGGSPKFSNIPHGPCQMSIAGIYCNGGFRSGFPEPKKCNVILVLTSEHPGWGVDPLICFRWLDKNWNIFPQMVVYWWFAMVVSQHM